MRDALELVVDDQLGDQLRLCRIAFSIYVAHERRRGGLTKPNMYTNDVSVEIMKLYHPRCVSYISEYTV
jgi:hypothetical protein